MKRLICDIKPTSTDGERVYVKDSYIDLPFFNDPKHHFVLHPSNTPDGIIKKFWELKIDDETIIYVFPTRKSVYSDPNEWIEEVMNALNIPIESSDDVIYILHDRDFLGCNGLINGRQRSRLVYYVDKQFIIKKSEENEFGNYYGKLLVFQHNMEDDFFYSIVDDDIEDFNSWNDRWDWICKNILKW